jgi:hypothetical protein
MTEDLTHEELAWAQQVTKDLFVRIGVDGCKTVRKLLEAYADRDAMIATLREFSTGYCYLNKDLQPTCNVFCMHRKAKGALQAAGVIV